MLPSDATIQPTRKLGLRIDGTLAPPKVGETVRLRVAPEHLHWFDAQTGARV